MNGRQRNRYLWALKKVLQALEEEPNRILTREQLKERAMDYGRNGLLTEEEVEYVLLNTPQTIALEQSEWS